jgi:hypothetical protein
MSNFGPMRFAIGFLAFVLFGVFLAPRPASAGVVYTFTMTGSFTSSVSFEEPAVLTGTGTTTVTSFLSVSDTGEFWVGCGPIGSVSISSPGTVLGSAVFFNSSQNCSVSLSVPTIDALGTYIYDLSSLGTVVTLTIASASTSTPEPSPFLLLGTGLLGLGPFIRRAALS